MPQVGAGTQEVHAEVPLNSLGSHLLDIPATGVYLWVTVLQTVAVCHEGQKEEDVYSSQEESFHSAVSPVVLYWQS